MGRGDYRSYYKGHMDKMKVQGIGGFGLGGWRPGEKRQTTVFE